MLVNSVSQKIYSRGSEHAFRRVENKAKLLEAVEKVLKIFVVLCLIGASYQNVVQIHENAIESAADHVHQSLESLSGIFQAERHAQELIESERRNDSSFWNVRFVDGDLVVASYEVDF